MECYENLVHIEDVLGAHNYKPLEVVITGGERVWIAPESFWQTVMSMPSRM